MDDPGPRLSRWCLIERHVELATPADEQMAYISGAEYMGQAIWDLAANTSGNGRNPCPSWLTPGSCRSTWQKTSKT